jgi:hypothetical protein
MRLTRSYLFSVPFIVFAAALMGCGNDATAPSVSARITGSVALSQPAAGAHLTSEKALLVARVDEPGEVSEVVFFADGRVIGRCATAPYQIEWLPQGIGAHTLGVAAIDRNGLPVKGPEVFVDVTSSFNVFLTRPALWQRVSGVVEFRAEADTEVLTRVAFYVDGDSVGCATTLPFSLNWNSALAIPGNHNLFARAVNGEGKQGMSSQIVFEVADTRDRVPPAVIIARPAAWQEVSGLVTILTDARDNVGVTSVEFFVDGSSLGTAICAPFQKIWDASAAAPGNHSIYVLVSDAAGNTAVAGPIYATIADATDRIAPTVAILEPAPWQRVSGTVPIVARAWDDHAVARLEFRIGDIILDTIVGPGPAFTYALHTTLYTNGNYTVSCIAYDAAGHTAFSGEVLEIKNPPLVAYPRGTLSRR